MKKLIFTLFVALYAMFASAQPKIQKVQIIIIPDSNTALYKCGDNASVKLIVLDQGVAMDNVQLEYNVSYDLMEPHKEGTLTIKNGEATLKLGTMKEPGYLRVKGYITNKGKKYSGMCTVGFSPEKIRPTVKLPQDFKEFWTKNLNSVKNIPLNPIMELVEEKCTKDVNVYHVSYGNIGGTRMYGMLTIPTKEGKYPGILRFPGAGVGEKGGDIVHAAKGAIILELGIHGIPVNLKGNIYSDLSAGALANYALKDMGNKENYYYKRVFLGCVKGIDFLLSLPECNGNIGTFGGSQGGALSIVTSALDTRIKGAVAYFPALCDMEGYTHGRAGGWPHTFKNKDNCTKENLNTAEYYDVANFARILETPIYYLYGYNDLTCAPTTTRATYNVISSEKRLIIGENIGHWTYPEQMDTLWEWIINKLK